MTGMSTDEGMFHGQVIDGPDAGNLISASVPVWRYVEESASYLDGPLGEPARQKVEGWYRIEGNGWRWIPGYRADEMVVEMKRRGIADDRLIDVLIEGSVQGYLDGIDAADEAESYQPPTRGEIERVEQPTFPTRSWDPDNPGCAPEICGGTKGDPCRWVVRTEGRAHDDDLLDEMRKAGIPSSKLDEVIDAGGADHYLASQDAWRAYCEANGLDPECRTCNEGGHQCGGCGHSIAHGAGDCRGAGGPGCPVHEELYYDPRPVCADRLMEGDEIYSPQTDQWYPVVSAETRDGITVVTIEGGFRFRVTSETEYSTKPGEAHRAILASGLDVEGVVKSS